MSKPYDLQDRGADADYAAYFAGMDRSMQQKVALTTAHFPPTGCVADMGSGSGQATFDLASLYGGLSLVGVDIDPKTVEIASRTHVRSNLRFIEGDIAAQIFPEGSLDGVLDSSVLHHVTSFNGFSRLPLERALDHQTAALRDGGVLVVRDFVLPRGPDVVWLDLHADDGRDDGPVPELSTAALFVRFAATWDSSLGRATYVERDSGRRGVRRFEVTHRVAAEFVLRKDYRDHWDAELREEYTYFSQLEFEQAFRARGLRIVTSVELCNPWIVEHRFRDQVALFDTSGAPLPTPPTNYLIVGEKVGAARGVRLEEVAVRSLDAPTFLELRRYRDVRDGHVYELASRPHQTIDVLPFFVHDRRAFVVCKHGFPRPIVNAASDAVDLLGQTGAGYVTEPISVLTRDGEATRDAVTRALAERAGGVDVRHVDEPWSYFTSPGGIDERVDAYLVEIAPWQHERVVDNYTPFIDAGSVRFLDATQVLRACHVGGMFDARLELNISRLCHTRGIAKGPWIGAELDFADHAVEPVAHPIPTSRACFERLLDDAPPQFLELCEGTFVERNAAGDALRTARFEYVRPRVLSHNTITMLPVMRVGERLWVGLEPRELPAVQAANDAHAGVSGTGPQFGFLTLPALRLPRTTTTLDDAIDHARKMLEREHHLTARRVTPLGGRYYPSTGVTPEVAYPFVVDVADVRPTTPLCFRPLAEALSLPLVDAHLLTALFRLLHATS